MTDRVMMVSDEYVLFGRQPLGFMQHATTISDGLERKVNVRISNKTLSRELNCVNFLEVKQGAHGNPTSRAKNGEKGGSEFMYTQRVSTFRAMVTK